MIGRSPEHEFAARRDKCRNNDGERLPPLFRGLLNYEDPLKSLESKVKTA